METKEKMAQRKDLKTVDKHNIARSIERQKKKKVESDKINSEP